MPDAGVPAGLDLRDRLFDTLRLLVARRNATADPTVQEELDRQADRVELAILQLDAADSTSVAAAVQEASGVLEEATAIARRSRTVSPIVPRSPAAAIAAEPAFSAAEAVVADAVAAASAGPAPGGGAPAVVAPPSPLAAPPLLSATAEPTLAVAGTPVSLPALRLGSRGDLVRAWQSFLLGQRLDPGGLDGVFGDKTAAATRALQSREGLSIDGVAGRQTILRAMQLGFELIEEPAQDTSGSNFPPRPDFPPLVSTAARQAVFGRFDFVPEPRPDNKENIRILGTWEADNIVTVPIPQLRTALGAGAPAGMRFHRRSAGQLQALWSDWERAGLLERVVSFHGSFVPRFIRGSTSQLSNHAFGTAFDVNARENPLGARPPLVGERGGVRELVPLAHRHGFWWGGHFGSRPDGMHFEVAVLV